MENNIVLDKALAFSLRIVRLCHHLNETRREYVLSKEVLVSGTNIGKHINAAIGAEGREFIISEFGIARRRTAETQSWLLLLVHGELLSTNEYESIEADRVEIAKLINSILSSSRSHEHVTNGI